MPGVAEELHHEIADDCAIGRRIVELEANIGPHGRGAGVGIRAGAVESKIADEPGRHKRDAAIADHIVEIDFKKTQSGSVMVRVEHFRPRFTPPLNAIVPEDAGAMFRRRKFDIKYAVGNIHHAAGGAGTKCAALDGQRSRSRKAWSEPAMSVPKAWSVVLPVER